MPVLLASSQYIPPRQRYRAWVCAGTPPAGLDPAAGLPDLGAQLEAAFDAIRDAWWVLGRRMAEDDSAYLAHTPVAAANISDLGMMLAWTRLVETWADTAQTILLVCDDPWLWRHLARLRVLKIGKAPPLRLTEAKLALRGFLARSRVALSMALACLRLGKQAAAAPKQSPWILVYGHPAADAQGHDGYFGDLMADIPDLQRLLHVDCAPTRALDLAADGRSRSLHAWGTVGAALGLPFVRWRCKRAREPGPLRWLLRRAEALEGATGTAAMIQWQITCQARFLAQARPARVAFPWEGHSWERRFIAESRKSGTETIGYQHTVVGNREWNYSPNSAPEGAACLPDRILVTGPAAVSRLESFGVAPERLEIGGALRGGDTVLLTPDPAAPLFVALPWDQDIAAQMIEAIRPLGAKGWRFLVKDHPMTPHAFAESPGVTRTDRRLEFQDGVSGVLYAATTVGLEAWLGGLPTIRFQPVGKVPNDVLPEGADVPAVAADGLEAALHGLRPPRPYDPTRIWSRPDKGFWRHVLSGEAGR